MFQNLTQNLFKIFTKLKGSGALSEEHIDAAMREIRVALLEADVAVPVIKKLIHNIKDKALGQKIFESIKPGEMVVKIFHDELVALLSMEDRAVHELNLQAVSPVSIMMVGLQGSGKTTNSAKIAALLKKQEKKVLLVSLDTYRPAAQEQLRILGQKIEVDTLEIIPQESLIEITNRSLKKSKQESYDIVIFDTAGRLHIDSEMMQELRDIKTLVKPTEVILVADSMLGQDSVNIATQFNDSVEITSVLLTRVDGDSRGGAALSIKYTINKPIKFLSVGEKIEDLEKFDPERIASRILDKGDIVALVENAASMISERDAQDAMKKMQSGKFDLNDFLTQLRSINKLGGVSKIMNMLPGMNAMAGKIDLNKLNNNLINKQEAIILSMTKKEKAMPDLLNASRRRRIAAGSGVSVNDVNKLIKQYMQIKDMMKKMQKLGPSGLMKSGIGKLLGM